MQVSEIMRGLDDGSLHLVYDANTFEPFYSAVDTYKPRRVPDEVFAWYEIVRSYHFNRFLFNRLMGS
jgi:hypothetical protein